MDRLTRIAARIVAAQRALATNRSSFSYEYDQNSAVATVLFDTTSGRLTLEVVATHTKTGLGAGTRSNTFKFNLGTLQSPKLGQVRSILKKYGHPRGRFSSPFSAKWKASDGRQDSLGNIIQTEQMESGGLNPEDMRQEIINLVEKMSPRQLGKLYDIVMS